MVNFLRNKAILGMYEAIYPYLKTSLHLDEELNGRNVLVFAPHADDEAIGCAGTIMKHVQRGGIASCVIFTKESEERNDEATQAAVIMGFSDLIKLDYPVETLKDQSQLPGKIKEFINKNKPDSLFVPFFMDNHVDHRALNKALFETANSVDINPMVYAYPVWSPVYPNTLIDISDVWLKKEAAIECYKTQLVTRDYVAIAKSLATYWAKVKSNDLEQVESFFKISFQEYVALGRRLNV